jgi:hypothetical protein
MRSDVDKLDNISGCRGQPSMRSVVRGGRVVGHRRLVEIEKAASVAAFFVFTFYL